jgi:uncharacterized damage-inducible protein DinB
MSKVELVRELYGYNEWANGRLVEVAEGLDADVIRGEARTSWGSVLATLGHVAGAQEVWLARWTGGRNPRPIVEAQALDSLDEVKQALERTQAGLREFLVELTDARLDAELEYRDSAGNENRRLLWRLMVHVVNHGTYHRGEVAAELTALGRSPGDLDFVYWVRDRV